MGAGAAEQQDSLPSWFDAISTAHGTIVQERSDGRKSLKSKFYFWVAKRSLQMLKT